MRSQSCIDLPFFLSLYIDVQNSSPATDKPAEEKPVDAVEDGDDMGGMLEQLLGKRQPREPKYDPNKLTITDATQSHPDVVPHQAGLKEMFDAFNKAYYPQPDSDLDDVSKSHPVAWGAGNLQQMFFTWLNNASIESSENLTEEQARAAWKLLWRFIYRTAKAHASYQGFDIDGIDA